jgi:hypothetical protein
LEFRFRDDNVAAHLQRGRIMRATATRSIQLLSQLCCVAAALSSSAGEDTTPTAIHLFLGDMRRDYARHYASESLVGLGASVGLAGLLANTKFDVRFRNAYQGGAQTGTGDDYSAKLNDYGDLMDMKLSVPLYLGAMLLGGGGEHADGRSEVSAWGTRSLRALCLGAPQQVALSHALGGGRPGETGSRWDPFEDGNSVSGHAFHGAVPLLTAARMAESPLLKYPLYALSLLPGFARINDDRHYLSHVVLGWSLAYLATDTVASSGETGASIRLAPLVMDDGIGIGAEMAF